MAEKINQQKNEVWSHNEGNQKMSEFEQSVKNTVFHLNHWGNQKQRRFKILDIQNYEGTMR